MSSSPDGTDATGTQSLLAHAVQAGAPEVNGNRHMSKGFERDLLMALMEFKSGEFKSRLPAD